MDFKKYIVLTCNGDIITCELEKNDVFNVLINKKHREIYTMKEYEMDYYHKFDLYYRMYYTRPIAITKAKNKIITYDEHLNDYINALKDMNTEGLRINKLATFINKKHEIFGNVIIEACEGDLLKEDFEKIKNEYAVRKGEGPYKKYIPSGKVEKIDIINDYIEQLLSNHIMTIETSYITKEIMIEKYITQNTEYSDMFMSLPYAHDDMVMLRLV